MKPARWGVSMAFAASSGSGAYESHVFVDDSAAPICRPHAPGSPGTLYPTMGAQMCNECYRRGNTAWWSSTSFGRRRLWVASTASFSGKPAASGLADNDAQALEQVLVAVAALFEEDAPVLLSRGAEADALKVARERRAEERDRKTSAATGAQLTEYVYRHFEHFTYDVSEVNGRISVESRSEWRTRRAKIVRKTPKVIFIQDEEASYTTDSGSLVLKTRSLDRATLESGKPHRYGWTLNPEKPYAIGESKGPAWAEVLGVSLPCSAADVKRAFRRAAKKAHPDQGGSADAFARVKAAYDQAIRHVGAA